MGAYLSTSIILLPQVMPSVAPAADCRPHGEVVSRPPAPQPTGPQSRAGVFGLSSAVVDVTIAACNGAISAWAEQFNPLEVSTRLARPVGRGCLGDRKALPNVRIDYRRKRGVDTRQDRIDCSAGRLAIAEAK
jgi:hypothetical protein